MPIVPTYQRQTQSPLSPINTHGLRLPQQNAFSALADAGNHLLAQGMQEYEKHALAKAQENALDFEQYAQSLAHDPQTGLFTKQGKAALGQSQIYADRLDERRQETLSRVPAGYAREQLAQQLQREIQRHVTNWQQYEIGQRQHHEHETYLAGNEMTILQSRDLGLTGDGGKAFTERLHERFQAIDTYAAVYGKADDWRQHEKIILQEKSAQEALLNWAKTQPQQFLAQAEKNVIYRSADPDDQFRAKKLAEQLIAVQRAEFQDQLAERVKDANAAYLLGKEAPNAPTQQDFIAAYGAEHGVKAYRQFASMQQLGTDIAAVQKLSPEQQRELIKTREPKTGSGFAEATKRHDVLVRAVMTVNQARQQDPVGYAVAAGEAHDLDFSQPNTLRQSLRQRASTATRLSQHYRNSLAVFSQTEAAFLGDMLNQAPTSQVVAYLDAMRQGLGQGEEYYSALAQITQHAPSAATAGAIMGKNGHLLLEEHRLSADVSVSPDDAAKTIIEGANARKGGKTEKNGVVNIDKGIPMPSDQDLRDEFNNIAGEAFAGNTNEYARSYEVAKDYYAGVMARKGKFSAKRDDALWKQAINVATGGVHDYSGYDILLPWGMSAEQFEQAVHTAWQAQVIGAGIDTPPEHYGLQSYGDSQYLIRKGGEYLRDKKGIPVILRIDAERLRLGEGGIPE